MLTKLCNVNWIGHIFFGALIRIILIFYGNYHDQISAVPYTDVDYKVFTDAARHVYNGKSPYDRHTYRYSPIVAIFLIPNVTLHYTFGKFLFCFVDIIDAVLIRLIVKNCFEEYQNNRQKSLKKNDLQKIEGKKQRKRSRKSNLLKYQESFIDFWANISMIFWLYNPLTLVIGTRGNCDSIAVFFVLLTLYFMQNRKYYFVSGIFHGLSIHFRLYPIVFSLSLFMHLSKFAFYSTEDRKTSKNDGVKQIHCGYKNVQKIETSLLKSNVKEKKTIFKKEYLLYLIPNVNQMKLVIGCCFSLLTLIGLFYYFYGYKFLYETYIYHFLRKDTRHNFSLYFYLLYITAWIKNIGVWQKVLIVLPQIILLFVFSIHYGLNRFSLNFCILIQTIVFVTYNTVVTSQYFVWIMAILPLCLWQIQISIYKAIFLFIIWFSAQFAWLFPAYLLEFHGYNTFLFIWIQSVSLFCVNVVILGRLIMNFMPLHNKMS